MEFPLMISAADIRPLWGEVELISLIFYSRLVFADFLRLLFEDLLVRFVQWTEKVFC
jgi:hypothetical protein